MRLTHLSLHNFRNYVRLDLDLPPGVSVLVGDNAQGKTNLLEAVYYLATTRSPHALSDRELVNWLAADREPLPYARLVGRVLRTGELSRRHTLEITLTQQAANGPNAANGTRYRKQIRLNGVNRKALDLLGHLNVVLFLPEDIILVSGPPSGRRRYLDATLCQIDPPYCRALARYNQVVTQRNALLRDLRERGGDPSQLHFWDERLVDHGAYLVACRSEALSELDRLAHAVHGELTAGVERLHLRYEPSVELDLTSVVRPQATSVVSAAFRSQLQALRHREIGAGVTLVGPHRDEVRFLIDDVDAGIFGSRGQQRTAALSLKLAEVELMHDRTGDQPVLLLDDVLSELDARRRHFLLGRLAAPDGPEQAVITTTDLEILPVLFRERSHLWRVDQGRLAPVMDGE